MVAASLAWMAVTGPALAQHPFIPDNQQLITPLSRASSFPEAEKLALIQQDLRTLDPKPPAAGNSPESPSNPSTLELEHWAALYRITGTKELPGHCGIVAASLKQKILQTPEILLEIVDAEITANPACACEIVKCAVSASQADTTVVVSIVRTAINAAPETMRVVSQCAIAEAPESLVEIQTLLARLDPGAGDSGQSTSKSKAGMLPLTTIARHEVQPNPLDLPPGIPYAWPIPIGDQPIISPPPSQTPTPRLGPF